MSKRRAFLASLCILSAVSAYAGGPALSKSADPSLSFGAVNPKMSVPARDFPFTVFQKLTDPSSDKISPDAVQLANSVSVFTISSSVWLNSTVNSQPCQRVKNCPGCPAKK